MLKAELLTQILAGAVHTARSLALYTYVPYLYLLNGICNSLLLIKYKNGHPILASEALVAPEDLAVCAAPASV